MMADRGEFALSEFEANRLLAAVNERIGAQAARAHEAVAWRWIRWVVPAAAAVVLFLGITFFGREEGRDMIAVIDSMLLQQVDTASESVEMALYDDLDGPTVEVLLEDYGTRPTTESSGLLLDDLTEDEYEYLAKNFDVGELL